MVIYINENACYEQSVRIGFKRNSCGAASPRSGRRHKAWGGAQRNPRIINIKTAEPAKRPIELATTKTTFAIDLPFLCILRVRTAPVPTVGRSAGFDYFSTHGPGVPLRFTPGFTPSPASRVVQNRKPRPRSELKHSTIALRINNR